MKKEKKEKKEAAPIKMLAVSPELHEEVKMLARRNGQKIGFLTEELIKIGLENTKY